MKLLLDENLPKRLKTDLQEHEVYTVGDKGWNSIKNGELLKLLIEEDFDALITFDKNLQYQQNFRKYSIPVIILNAPIKTYIELTKLSPLLLDHLKNNQLKPGPLIIPPS